MLVVLLNDNFLPLIVVFLCFYAFRSLFFMSLCRPDRGIFGVVAGWRLFLSSGADFHGRYGRKRPQYRRSRVCRQGNTYRRDDLPQSLWRKRRRGER